MHRGEPPSSPRSDAQSDRRRELRHLGRHRRPRWRPVPVVRAASAARCSSSSASGGVGRVGDVRRPGVGPRPTLCRVRIARGSLLGCERWLRLRCRASAADHEVPRHDGHSSARQLERPNGAGPCQPSARRVYQPAAGDDPARASRSARRPRLGAAVERARAAADQRRGVAAPGSGASRTARMTATPAAPAARTAGTAAAVTPPMASTGTLARRRRLAQALDALRRAERRLRRRREDRAEGREVGACVGGAPRPARASRRRSARRGGRQRARRRDRQRPPPRCTPSAPAASATSMRSFTSSSAPRAARQRAQALGEREERAPAGRDRGAARRGSPAASAAATTRTGPRVRRCAMPVGDERPASRIYWIRPSSGLDAVA